MPRAREHTRSSVRRFAAIALVGNEWTVQAFYTSVAKALTPSGVVSVQVKARTACNPGPTVQPPEGADSFVHHVTCTRNPRSVRTWHTRRLHAYRFGFTSAGGPS